MGLLDLSKPAFPQTTVSKDIVAHYARIRAIRLRLNHELVARLSSDVLEEGARSLGMLRDGVFVFETEDESAVLMDYCIYDVYREGRNALEQYLCECTADVDCDEMACLRAMQDATYTLLAVLGVEPGVGCQVRDLFAEQTHLLVDIGFSETAQPGALLATRLLDFGGFVTTGGAALPLGILDREGLDEWQRKLRAGVNVEGYDPAPLIRAALRRGASSHIRYEGGHAQGRPRPGRGSPAARSSARQRRALAKHRDSTPAASRRCTCGSGRMFKNCCGKR